MRPKTQFRTALVAVAVVALATISNSAGPALAGTAAISTLGHGHAVTVVNACGPAPSGYAQCMAEVRTDVHSGKGVFGPAARSASAKSKLPAGYSPATLQTAYKLPKTGGAGQTVALVDAGDDPNAEADLAVYRATYGLPACTTANGCFSKVNQAGKASPLPSDIGWDVEISLDLDMVSASCPSCHILLVEGDDNSDVNLADSENTAVALGAKEVSNSYGESEYNGMQAYYADYSHPGVAILASSGDSGYGVPNFPAVAGSVIAVGGTTLTKTTTNSRGWTETAWIGASSGCSAWVDKPAWQTDPNCPGRMVADVASDADPNTGPAVYDTDNGEPGWLVVGGTSAASPFVAGVIALAGNPSLFPNASYLYSHASKLYDVVGGNNAIFQNCGGDYQCNAVKGYDGPTGNGTPDGIGAF